MWHFLKRRNLKCFLILCIFNPTPLVVQRMLRKCPLTYLYPEVCEKHPGEDGGDEQEQGVDAEVDGGVDVPVGAVVREHPVGTAIRLQVTLSSWKPGHE